MKYLTAASVLCMCLLAPSLGHANLVGFVPGFPSQVLVHSGDGYNAVFGQSTTDGIQTGYTFYKPPAVVWPGGSLHLEESNSIGAYYDNPNGRISGRGDIHIGKGGALDPSDPSKV